MPLEKIAENIWIAEQPLRFLGIEVGARMTVVDLTGSGELLVHSPIDPKPELVEEINRLGAVKVVVAPNKMHHLFINSFRAVYPEAKLYLAPGLDKKRKDLSSYQLVKDGADYPWCDSLAHVLIEGAPFYNEVVFFHRSSASLIVADLGVNIGKESPFMTRALFKMMGMFEKFGWSTIEKKIFVKDPDRFSESIRLVLNWNFDRIILAHGRILQTDGKVKFRQAFGSDS